MVTILMMVFAQEHGDSFYPTSQLTFLQFFHSPRFETSASSRNRLYQYNKFSSNFLIPWISLKDMIICRHPRSWSFLPNDIILLMHVKNTLVQVVVLILIPSLKGHDFIYAVRSLKYILLVQYLPRVFRIYSFLKKVRWTSNILPETAGAKAAFNLFLYMLASHVW